MEYAVTIVFICLGVFVIIVGIMEKIPLVSAFGVAIIIFFSFVLGVFVEKGNEREYSKKEYKIEQTKTEIIGSDTTVYFKIVKIE